MEPALWAAKTGLDAQQTQMTVTANNLANVNTTGFKKSRAVFDDLLYQNLSQVGANTSQNTQAPTGLNVGTGVRHHMAASTSMAANPSQLITFIAAIVPSFSNNRPACQWPSIEEPMKIESVPAARPRMPAGAML